MNALDRLALAGRKYEQQTVPRSGSGRFSLADVLEAFDRHAIFELTPYRKDEAGKTARPDPVRKLKVSLLDDGISALDAGSGDTYEVFRTAPSGDISRVRIVATSPSGEKRGELRLLIGQRSYDHYFRDDPIFDAIESRAP